MKTQLPLQAISAQAAKKVDSSQFIPGSVKKIAQDYEAQFAELMLHEMKKSVGAEEQDTSNEFYQSLMQKEQANSLTSNNGGLGIQKMILDQIYPERWRTKEQLAAYEKATGPRNQNKIIAKELDPEQKIGISSNKIELRNVEKSNE